MSEKTTATIQERITVNWLRLTRFLGINGGTMYDDQEGQIRYHREGNVDGKVYYGRHVTGATYNWQEVVGTTAAQTLTNKTLTAPVIVNSNTPLVALNATTNGSPDTSTSSTVTYAEAVAVSLTLGAGTWTVYARGGGRFTHSAGNTVNVAVSINGTDGVGRTPNCSATVGQFVEDTGTVTGISGGGSIDVITKFHSGDAGTTAVTNPFVTAIAFRTA